MTANGDGDNVPDVAELEVKVFALIFVVAFVVALIVSCVALLRSSSKQKRLRAGPGDMRRADDAARGGPYDPEKAYRAAQDASNWGGGPAR
jgi:hypothetical protein